ncbi:potassium channel family protein [endosymbiont of Ridgeia piscesae]|jgi:voltage-gated potassium channel|uniref:BK channel n=1 Tax=endosymbiont of Ridgeia piscesae TaxID=54398 RepID=A0A0T5Z3Q2_9GAMM|nr:potassium channel protein [endosymbiont of Ridgeia piscesae]KRT56501.1 Trk K+ transport system, NAD-binding component [endosymbiont of Ridgeia piscesae]KRT57532.1 voltage-gated potassium channel [endosymbiont of Ridgeia piscesae]
MGISHTLIRLSYALEGSARYRRAKHFFYDLLENPLAPVRPYFDIFMILLVLLSVWLLIYEVRHDLGLIDDVVERIAVTVFILEYLLRFWIYNDSHAIILKHYERAEFVNERFRLWPALREILARKWDYMSQPLAVIDLLAIIPSYRPLRFLRIFLLFRLFKLFRYTRSISGFVKVLSEKRTELLTLLIFMAFITFTAATAFFFFEFESSGLQFNSFVDSLYWAVVTMSTVGYGDITPQTIEGRVITLVLIISGLGVIAFFTSIIVSGFGEKMHEVRSLRVYSEVERKRVGIILCGFGRVGEVVAQRLAEEKNPFVVVDTRESAIHLAKQRGYLAVQGNAEDSQLLANLGVERWVERLLCLTGNDVINVYITLSARQMNRQIEIISRANHRENITKLMRAGATHTVAPYEVAGLIAAEYVGQPVAFEAIYGMLSGEREVGVDAVRIHPGTKLVGCRLGEVDFQQSKLIAFGVVRDGSAPPEGQTHLFELGGRVFHFNPKHDFELAAGDLLLLFGHEYSIAHFRDALERGGL